MTFRNLSISLFLGALFLASINVSAQKVGLNIGNKAPELEFKSPDGKLYKLSDLRGKMVLIDFWASWCGPCRRENPTVVEAYKEYKDRWFRNGKTFTVYSVSLDRNKEAWKKAIEADSLTWEYHVSDLKQWRSAAAKKYKVRGIPTNFLIDGDGIIVAKTLRGNVLKRTLEKFVKQDRAPETIRKELKATFVEYKESLEKLLESGIDPESKAYKNAVKEKKKIEKLIKKWK